MMPPTLSVAAQRSVPSAKFVTPTPGRGIPPSSSERLDGRYENSRVTFSVWEKSSSRLAMRDATLSTTRTESDSKRERTESDAL